MKTATVTKIKPAFVDERGNIIDVLNDVLIKHVGLLTARKGDIRANHYHNKQSQFNYIISGRIKVTTWDFDMQSEKTVSILEKGDLIEIPPKVAHIFEFLEASVFLDLTTESRSNDGFEKDTVRLNK